MGNNAVTLYLVPKNTSKYSLKGEPSVQKYLKNKFLQRNVSQGTSKGFMEAGENPNDCHLSHWNTASDSQDGEA